MAEISTIARPYAEALLKAVKDSKDAGLAKDVLSGLEQIQTVVSDPQLKELVNDPSLKAEQLYALVSGVLGSAVPAQLDNFLKLIIENGRLDALPQVTSQFRRLVNEENKEADVLIESAFPLNDDQLKDLVVSLDKKFPGLKLLPQVVVDPSLIGGVRVSVGDKVLDGTVKARLAEMQSALTS